MLLLTTLSHSFHKDTYVYSPVVDRQGTAEIKLKKNWKKNRWNYFKSKPLTLIFVKLNI